MRVLSPRGPSTFHTSAPRSPSTWVQSGPETTVETSSTRRPASGPRAVPPSVMSMPGVSHDPASRGNPAASLVAAAAAVACGHAPRGPPVRLLAHGILDLLARERAADLLLDLRIDARDPHAHAVRVGRELVEHLPVATVAGVHERAGQKERPGGGVPHADSIGRAARGLERASAVAAAPVVAEETVDLRERHRVGETVEAALGELARGPDEGAPCDAGE